jgi:hypothetical protein
MGYRSAYRPAKVAPVIRGGQITCYSSISYNPNTIMKLKNWYIAPECDEIAVSLEGVIAASGDPNAGSMNFGDPFSGGNTELPLW